MKNFEIKNNDCHAALAMTKSVQSGRSMIEMLGVLAIIGVLSVGGIAGYSKAMMKYRINKTIEQITLIAGNVRTFFSSQNNFEGIDCLNDSSSENNCKILKKAKLVPDEMWNSTYTSLVSVFGTDTDIEQYDNKTLIISVHEIPTQACIELVSHNWNNANITTIVETVSPNRDETHYAYESIISIDEAVTACSDDGGTTISAINFYVKL
ncbi:MAG: hypothetical protein IJ525_01020 [Alphaproteobacteria bacterium]|nr:hypothetical protein [Alphaproteobacteria bacterium]